MEKDKSSHKRGKLPSIKTELLLSWVKVGASSQLDPFKHQQESNPVLKEGAEFHFLLQHPYKDLGIQQVLSLTQPLYSYLKDPTLSRSHLLLLFTSCLSQPKVTQSCSFSAPSHSLVSIFEKVERNFPIFFTISGLHCFTINWSFSLICLSRPQTLSSTAVLALYISFFCPF